MFKRAAVFVEISVVIPVYNEEENIETLYARLSKALAQITDDWELIFVNDGSGDATLRKIKTLSAQDGRARYIDLSRNFGQQIALSAGLDYASGEAVALIDADLQDPPELIPEMHAKLREGYQVVYAKRKKRKGESFFKLATARLFYRLLNRWASIEIPLDAGDFRVVDKSIVEALRKMPEQHKFLRGQISWLGFRQTYVLYDRDPRLAGDSKYSLKKLFKLAADGITGFSNAPLKLVSYMGFTASGLAFALIIWVLFVRLFGETHFNIEVQLGWASEMIAILFLGGVQLIGIGILGEYIARMNDNIKSRPIYFVNEKSPTLTQEEDSQE